MFVRVKIRAYDMNDW